MTTQISQADDGLRSTSEILFDICAWLFRNMDRHLPVYSGLTALMFLHGLPLHLGYVLAGGVGYATFRWLRTSSRGQALCAWFELRREYEAHRQTILHSLELNGLHDDDNPAHVSVAAGPGGHIVTIKTPKGVADSRIADIVDAFASDLEAWGVKNLRDVREKHGTVKFLIQMVDPLAEVLASSWPGVARIKEGPVSLSDPMPFGFTDTGETFSLPTKGSTYLISGLPGQGKTVLLHAALSFAAADPSAHIVCIDLKFGVGLGRHKRRADVFCGTPKEAVAALQEVFDTMQSRYRLMESEGIYEAKVTDPRFAPIWIFIDEMAELFVGQDPDEKKLAARANTLLVRIMSLGRAAHIQLVCATQRPSVESLGGSEVRSRYKFRIATRLADEQSSIMALGDSAVRAGAVAHELPTAVPDSTTTGAGLFFCIDETSQLVKARAWYLTDDVVDALVALNAKRRKDWLTANGLVPGEPRVIPEPNPAPKPPPAEFFRPHSLADLEAEFQKIVDGYNNGVAAPEPGLPRAEGAPSPKDLPRPKRSDLPPPPKKRRRRSTSSEENPE